MTTNHKPLDQWEHSPMTRKHFTAVASMIHDEIEFAQQSLPPGSAERDHVLSAVSRMAARMASEFEDVSPRFDRERFYRAAGLTT